ncbi:MAG: DUF2092 domain-containing protein [Paracoccaceae bacterium]
MRRLRGTIIRLGLACVLCGPALAQDSETPEAIPDIDAEALEIVAAASDYLTSQKTIGVSWFVSYDDVIDGREKITHMRSGFNLLDRDRGFVAETEDGMDTRSFFYDGASFTVYNVEADAYSQVPFFGDYERLVDRIRDEYGLALPIWSILSRDNKEEFVKSAEHVAYMGRTRLAGEIVHHIALSNYDSDWQIWITDDAEAPLIRMIVGTDPYVQGWPQFRAYFNSWDMSPEIGEDAFTFAPGEDTEIMVWPRTAPSSRIGGQ